MIPFLQSLASYVHDSYPGDLSRICMVFPNRRAGLFFTRYLSGLIDRPVWKPAVFTIADLMASLSGLEYADDLDLLFRLHAIHNQERRIQESFDEFYSWGEVMLSDFDDVDKYLVDAADLFQNLASVRELDRKFDYLTGEQIRIIQRFWKSFNPASPGEQQEKFLQVWEVLYGIYSRFTGSLLEEGVAYEGLAYRQVALAIRAGKYPETRFDRMIIAGFNALNRCEDVLFEYLKDHSLADFFWDYDQYYMNDEGHEAGRFLRKLVRKYPPPVSGFSSRELGHRDMHISLYPVPSDAGQARMVPLILEKTGTVRVEDVHDTAVVLADEHLLVSVLHSLPDGIKDINVTMGYPVSQTALNGLLELILLMHKNTGQGEGKDRFYYQDVLAVLNHQNLRSLYPRERDSLMMQITSQNMIRVKGDLLQVNELYTGLFGPVPEHMSHPAWLIGILEQLSRATITTGMQLSSIEQEHLHHIYLRLRNLDQLISAAGIRLGLGTFYRLYRKAVSSSRIPFVGEPLAGLQVMGVLETRLLDFRNVVILSMNEGHFPKASASPSFIPHFLRLAFGLPTLEHRDAIYAYYFYRLIQRAETVSLIYNNNTEGPARGEPSRFLYQLQYDPRIKTVRNPVDLAVRIHRPGPLNITKTPGIIRQLEKYYVPGQENYLSPSALNTYLECGLRFFFSYVAGIRENEVVEEEIDSPVFGTIFHDAINMLYGSLAGREITEESLQQLLASESSHADAVTAAFTKAIGSTGMTPQVQIQGKNLLIREVLLQYIRNVLEHDRVHAPFRLIEMEGLHTTALEARISGSSGNVRLGGRIDRVDSAGGCTRIIDYKTGSSRTDFNRVEDLFTRHDRNRNKAVFQVLLYCRLYRQDPGGSLPSLQPGLYVLREMYDTSYEYPVKMGAPYKTKLPVRFEEIAEVFEAELIRLVEEIVNPAEMFTQTGDRRSCAWCPYSGICKRELSGEHVFKGN